MRSFRSILIFNLLRRLFRSRVYKRCHDGRASMLQESAGSASACMESGLWPKLAIFRPCPHDILATKSGDDSKRTK